MGRTREGRVSFFLGNDESTCAKSYMKYEVVWPASPSHGKDAGRTRVFFLGNDESTCAKSYLKYEVVCPASPSHGKDTRVDARLFFSFGMSHNMRSHMSFSREGLSRCEVVWPASPSHGKDAGRTCVFFSWK